jgi:endogenous inhibitor of DNA gyrase (YacG/DUF329 family)
MATDVEIKCAYCDTKEKFSEYKEAPYHGWTIIGWNMNTNTPYAKCPKCGEGKEEAEESANRVRRKSSKPPVDEDRVDSEPPKKKRGRPRKVKE